MKLIKQNSNVVENLTHILFVIPVVSGFYRITFETRSVIGQQLSISQWDFLLESGVGNCCRLSFLYFWNKKVFTGLHMFTKFTEIHELGDFAASGPWNLAGKITHD